MADQPSEINQEQPSEIPQEGQEANFEQSMDEELTPEQMEQLQQQMEQQGEFDDSQQQGEYDQSGMQDYQNSQGQYDDNQSEEMEYDDEEQLRKIRRDLLENLNRERRDKQMEPMYQELLSNLITNEYAQFLADYDHDKQYFEDNLVKQKFKFEGQYELCYIAAEYEEEVEQTRQHIYDYFMEIGYLFLEDSVDKKKILNVNINHIGLGIAVDKEKIVIVLMLSTKVLTVSRILSAENSGIEIRGKILRNSEQDRDKEIGLFACRVVSNEGLKEIGKGSGPEKIQYNRNTKEFIATLENHELDTGTRQTKYIELYTRINPDSIGYGKKNRDSEKGLSYKFLQFAQRVPAFVYPDPKYAEEDEAERLRIEMELNYKKEQERRQQEEEEKEKIKDMIADRDEDMEGSEEEDEEGQSQLDEEEDMKKPENKEQVISNKEIREDLERAINEAMAQHKEFQEHNLTLQQKIKAIRQKSEIYDGRQNEMAMNDHKYLNTLAHVHQIRLDLQQTQRNYNKMAQELQAKLEDKQDKCNQIKVAFMELKQEVARKAANSRNDKPIPEKQILEWEQAEIEKDKILQELRLDNLRLRNSLIKNQKILKKKEELAEGLHLIDFEQLKIENQTLNEKIEERNEDLHKLKKKNTNTVQILTHTREKLGFVQKKNEILKKENQKFETEQGLKRNELATQKREKESNQQIVLQFQQITGIARSSALKQDFGKLKDKVEDLRQESKQLADKLSHMHNTIAEYEEKKIKQIQMQQRGIPMMN